MPIRNVLFIAVDDLRPEINCYGKQKLVTPALDGLAARGVRFNHAYCQYPQCMPSRASLFSGRRPGPDWCGRVTEMLGEGEPSLPRFLRKRGVTTVSVGKTTHQNDDDPDGWSTRFCDTFYEQPYTFQGYCSGYQLIENQAKVRNLRQLHNQRRGDPEIMPPLCERADAPDELYPDGLVAARTVELIHQFAASSQPFFLSAGFYRPHLPWAVPGRYWDLYDRDQVDLADNPYLPRNAAAYSDLVDFIHYGDQVVQNTYDDFGVYREKPFPALPEDKQRECIHAYWASVSFVDAQIGKTLAALEQAGLADQTAVILWGDNGWHLGEHALWAKCTSFEESTRVPLIVRAPGLSFGGHHSDSLVELLDLYPTVCDLLGEPAPEHVEGRSLRPVLQGPGEPFHDAIFARVGFSRTIRTDRYRLTHYGPDGWCLLRIPNRGDLELFDLARDPHENVNVANEPEYEEIVHQLRARLEAMMPPTPAPA